MRIALLQLATLSTIASADNAYWDTSGKPAPVLGLTFTPDGKEAYTESVSISADFEGGDSLGVTFVLTNIGWGDNGATVKSSATVAGKKYVFNREVKWKQRPGVIAFGKTNATMSGDVVRLVHKAKDHGCELRFRSLAPAWRPRRGRIRFGDGYYEFGLPMPRAEVTGKIRVGNTWKSVRGVGQIDHSRTNKYPHEQAIRWYRFRGRGGDTQVQLTYMLTGSDYGNKAIRWMYVAHAGKIVYESYNYKMKVGKAVPDKKYKKYKAARRYTLTDGDKVDLTTDAPRVSSRTDYLASMGRLKRAVVSRFAKPVGYGLHGTWKARFKLEGLPKEVTGKSWMSQTFMK